MLGIILGIGNGERSAAAADTRHDRQAERVAAAISSSSTERLRSASAAAANVLRRMISSNGDQDSDHETITIRNRIAQGHEETTVALWCGMLSCVKAHNGGMRLGAYYDIVI